MVTLGMYDNPLSTESILKIVRFLKVNNTLQLLGLPDCPQGVKEKVRSTQEAINKKREGGGYQVKLEIKFKWIL